jgi:hypothetical protein
VPKSTSKWKSVWEAGEDKDRQLLRITSHVIEGEVCVRHGTKDKTIQYARIKNEMDGYEHGPTRRVWI